jgi:adenylate cyclase class IV
MSQDEKTDPYPLRVGRYLELEEVLSSLSEVKEKEQIYDLLEDLFYSMTPQERALVRRNG